jgi:phosphatidate phosphatase LPIN
MNLPPGPLLMSPDGLVSSFKREVIDRTPQSFKIECLTQILNLFPPDESPYYAGFGNRITDAVSYESVGVNKSKIFLINEKGDISQYNNYYRSSYHTINDLVHEMFPPVKGVNTYYGSYNFFKPPMPNIDINSLFK